jgi:fumarate reductase flavoprotein subunit
MAEVTKREFLRAAGAAASTAAAAAAIGGAPGALAAAARPRGGRWDLIVVGGGNAGLPAAIFAAERGARVLIVEAAGQVGGTLFLSSGQMSAAGTKLQRSRAVTQDSPQSHYDDVMRISGGTADPVLLKLAVEQAAPTFDWLSDHGLQVLDGHPVTGTTHDPYSHARYAWARDGGRAILAVLNAQLAPLLARGRVAVLTQTEVVELVQSRDGAVTGVVTKDATGRRDQHAARFVALTCGGYTANPAMYEKYEGAKTYTRATYPWSKGAGIELGLAAGGYVRGTDKHTPLFGAVCADRQYPSTIVALARHFPTDRPPWEILVNAAGRRFVCEDTPSHDAHEQGLRAQPDERCWAIFDEAIYRAAPPLVGGGFGGPWTPADTEEAFATGQPMFYRADSVRALAQAAGIDADGLGDTVAIYNRSQGRGVDTLGRRHMPLPIAKPPFHAVELQSWNLTSYAGIAVDGSLRVLRAEGTPVPNLYAAGELLGVGTTMGRAVCGGMSVMPALSLGRMLGREILAV